MKDLYARLGVASDATADDIAPRINTLQPSDARDCSVVLLDPKKRAVYDRTLSSLKVIAQIRQRLSMADTDLWSASRYSDLFDRAPVARSWRRSLSDIVSRHPLAAVALVGLAIYFASTLSPASRQQTRPATQTNAASMPPVAVTWDPPNPPLRPTDPPALQLPATGVLRKYGKWRGLAPLTIVTQSSGINRLVKIVNSTTGAKTLVFFIRDGESLKVTVPLGSYRIRVASGSAWYGMKSLFGTRTRMSELDDTFDFTHEGDSYLGHRVEMIPQTNGNLKEKDIALEAFDDGDSGN